MERKIDLRKHPRIGPLIIRAEYKIGEVSQEAYLINLSQGGAYLATKELLPIEQSVHLRITLPWDLGDLSAEAKVVWRSDMMPDSKDKIPDGIGLSFTHLSAQAGEKLKRFMDKFSKLAAQIEEPA